MDRAQRMRMEEGWALIWREIGRAQDRAALRTPSIVARASSSRRESLARAADRIRCGMVDVEGMTHGKDNCVQDD